MLSSLKLRQFRCFETLKVEPGGGVSIFVGENAQGKTSILESVCVLLRLQSPRASSMADLIKFEGDGFGIEGDLGEALLSFSCTPDGKKRMAIDGQAQRRRGDYLTHSGLVVWMANDDLNLVRGGVATRAGSTSISSPRRYTRDTVSRCGPTSGRCGHAISSSSATRARSGIRSMRTRNCWSSTVQF